MKRITKISSMLLLLLTTAWSSVMGQVKIDPPFDNSNALKASEVTVGKEISLWIVNTNASRWFIRTDNSDNKRSANFTEYCIFVVEDAGDGNIVLKRKVDGKYMQSDNGIQWSDSKDNAVKLSVSNPINEGFNINDANLNEAPTWDEGYQNYLVRFTNTATNAFLNGNENTGFSTGQGSWSAFLVKEYQLKDEINEYINKYTNVPLNSVGGLTAAARETLEGMPKSTEGDFENIKSFIASADKVAFSTDKAYRLTTPGRSSRTYLTIGSTQTTGEELSASNASQVWKFSGDEENGYTVGAQGRYMLKPTSVSNNGVPVESTTEAGNAVKFQIASVNNSVALYTIDAVGDEAHDKFHLASGSTLVGWDNISTASHWYLVEASSIDMEITDAGYATVNYPFAVKVPAGIKAYTGSLSAEKDVLNLNEIAGGIIPANTPVVLEGTEGTYSLTILADNTTPAIEGNALKGVLLSQEIVADKKEAYVLGNVESAVGFYKVAANDRILAANKAYIELPEATAQGIRSIVIGGPTTGIEDTVAEGAETEEYYDLQGRRVMNPTKGIYVTKSGKKVLFNK